MDDPRQLAKIQPDPLAVVAALDDDVARAAIGIGFHGLLARWTGQHPLELGLIGGMELVLGAGFDRRRQP